MVKEIMTQAMAYALAALEDAQRHGLLTTEEAVQEAKNLIDVGEVVNALDGGMPVIPPRGAVTA